MKEKKERKGLSGAVLVIALLLVFPGGCSLFDDDKTDYTLRGIDIAGSIITLYVGEERDIAVTLIPDGADGEIRYSLSDDETAAVTDKNSKGKVVIKGLALGETVLMAEAGGFVDRCTVRVIGREDRLLYVEPDTLGIQPGTYGEVGVHIQDRDTWDLTQLTFTSLNPAVVEIYQASPDALIVYGKTAGETVVQVSHPALGTAGVAVTVAGGDPAVEIVLEQNEYEVVVGKQLSVTVSLSGIGGGERDGFTWEVEQDGDYIKVQSYANTLIITGLEKGMAKVMVSHEKAEKRVTFTVFVLLESEVIKYITVNDDTLDLGMGEGSFTVTLVGGAVLDNINFQYEITEGDDVIAIAGSSNVCTVTKKKAGLAEIRVTHPKAENSILVQVIAR
jgi:hypothetical protein